MAKNTFSGTPMTEWLTEVALDDRDMRLIEDFSYTDPGGRIWPAPKGSVVNGASIPKALWSSIGSPYTGAYRRASIVHDVACGDPAVVRKEADKMFYQACLAGGCSVLRAKVLYAGVRVGAWASADAAMMVKSEAASAKAGPKLPSQHTPDELEMRARFTLISRELEKSGDNFEAIEKIVNKHLKK